MCGFAGLYDVNDSGNVPEHDVLEAMARLLAHRGPDDHATFQAGPVGFSHRRLSIVDIAGGHQPMTNTQGNVTIAFNGEVFNYPELRLTLERAGLTFRTESDTEVVAQMYAHHGLSFVRHLNGQFALAIWDHDRRRLVLARDRIGICPLFYTQTNGTLAFASEVKALRPALATALQFNAEVLDEIFTFWTPVPPRSSFSGIEELEPGHLLVAEGGKVSRSCYWEWSYPGESFEYASAPEACEVLESILDDATRIRLRADVPVGAYLSGGLDSSCLVSLVNRHASERLTTFSIQFEEDDLDESPYQRLLVEHLNTRHKTVTVNQQQLAEQFEESMWHIETPILRSAPVAMGILSRLARDSGFKVVLTGEGADECLGGYDIFKEAKVRRFWAQQPDSTWRPLLLKRLYPYLSLPKDGAAAYLKRFFGQDLQLAADAFFSHLPRWRTTSKIKQFYHPDFRASLNAADSQARIRARFEKCLTGQHPFNRAQLLESRTLMSGYLLSSQGDRMLMKNSVEGRFPFLDHRLIEFASSLHPKLKMKALNEKYLLKQTMKNQLPEQIVMRKKQPYRAPDFINFKHPQISNVLDRLLSSDAINAAEVFDPKKVSFLHRKAASKDRLTIAESQILMGILSTQAVYQNFISGALSQ